MYKLPKNQMVPKCPVCSLSGMMQKMWNCKCSFTGICHCTEVKMRCCLLYSG